MQQVCDQVWREMKGEDAPSLRWTALGLGALHEGVEAYLIGVFENAYLCTLHARRKTLLPRDIDLVRRIRGDDVYVHYLITYYIYVFIVQLRFNYMIKFILPILH